MPRIRTGLALAFLLLVALPTRGFETPVADPIVSGTAGEEYAEAAASDGTDYLVIWRGASVYGERYAARVSRDGASGAPVVLPVRQRVEYLVWTGNSYLAVWTSQEASGRYSIVALRLDREGNVILGPTGSLMTLKQAAFPMACIANGTQVALAYTDYSATTIGRKPQVLVLNADAQPLADLTLDSGDWRMGYDLAWNGTTFAGVWIASNGPDTAYDDRHHVVHAVRFDAGGVVDATPHVLLDETANAPQLVNVWVLSDGDGFLLFNRAEGRTFARRVSGDLSTTFARRLLPEPVEHAWAMKPLRAGGEFMLYIRVSSANVIIRLDPYGTPVSTEVIDNGAESRSLENTVVTTNGEDIAVVWTGYTSSSGCADSDLFVTSVTARALQRRFQETVSVGPRAQLPPLVAAGSSNLLVSWNSGSSVYARRFSHAGVPLDRAPLLLSECANVIAVEFNGRDYLAFVGRTGGFDIAYIPQEGTLQAEWVAHVDGGLVKAATDSGGTVLLWGNGSGYFVSRINEGGLLIDTVPVGPVMSHARGATMAAGDDSFLIAWDEVGEKLYCTPPILASPPIPETCYYRRLVRGARISNELVNLDPAGLDLSTAAPFESAPTIAWNGERWLVAWHSDGTPRSIGGPKLPDEIRARYVSPDGSVDEYATGRVIASPATAPTLRWDGSRFVVGWYPIENFAPSHAMRISWMQDLGAPLTSTRSVPSADGRAQLAPVRPGTLVVGYSRQTNDAGTSGLLRAFIDTFESAAPPRRRRAH